MALTTTALADLQTQLQELNSHMDKIRALEGALAEQENIKEEVRALREMMKQRELDLHDRSARHELRGGFDDEEEENISGDHEDDMDDTSSIATMVPHELERVEEEDEEQLAADAQGIAQTPNEVESQQEMQQEQQRHGEAEEARIEQIEDEEARRRRNDELGRPRTPEPTNLGMRDGDRDPFASLHRPCILERSSILTAAPRHASPSSPLSKVAATGSIASSTGDTSEEVFEQVLNQVSALMALTTSLEAQHIAAQSTIAALESKVQALEASVKATEPTQLSKEVQTSPSASSSQPSLPAITDDAQERESLTTMVMEWKKSIEGQWSNVREDWDKERERLSRAREQWESQSKSMDSGLEKLATLQSAATAAFQQQQQRERERELEQHQHCAELVNGDAVKHIGLATPPSPRSLSSDSNRPRRRRSGGSRRGRSRQRSHSGSCERDVEFDTDTDITLASEDPSPSNAKTTLPAPRSFSPSHLNATEEQDEDEEEDTVLGTRSKSGAATLATPESSVYKFPTLTAKPIENQPEADVTGRKPTTHRGGDRVRRTHFVKLAVSHVSWQAVQIQATIGVLVLAVAAAAVIWRVKPET